MAYKALFPHVGAWRSLVARLLREQEAGGSNPLAPTISANISFKEPNPIRRVYREREKSNMEEQQIGWLGAIIIGALAGWLAEKFMKSRHGLLTNIILGVIGAGIANTIFIWLGISVAGWVGYLIAGFIGACLLIAASRLFKKDF